MPAGSYDRIITIEQKTTVKDALNQPVESWSDFRARVRASRRDVTGRELIRGGQEVATMTTIFRTWYFDGVTTEMRINEDGRLYNIISVAELGRRRELELTCTARVA